MGIDVHERRNRNGEDDPNPTPKKKLPSEWHKANSRQAKRSAAIGAYYRRKAQEKKYIKEYLSRWPEEQHG